MDLLWLFWCCVWINWHWVCTHFLSQILEECGDEGCLSWEMGHCDEIHILGFEVWVSQSCFLGYEWLSGKVCQWRADMGNYLTRQKSTTRGEEICFLVKISVSIHPLSCSSSVVSDSSRPHGLQPTRLLHPWDFPGKSTGVGCHRLLCYSILGLLISPSSVWKIFLISAFNIGEKAVINTSVFLKWWLNGILFHPWFFKISLW